MTTNERETLLAETRPYGPNGEEVCFKCGMKNEAAAKRQFDRYVGDTK